MSAVHGPTPLTATSALMGVAGIEIAEALEIEAAPDHRLGDRLQGADFGVRQSAGAQIVLGRPGDFGRLERDDARLQAAENGGSAGDRHLLGDDDRREAREARFSAAKRRPSARRGQAFDQLRVFRAQALGGFVQTRFIDDQGTGMIGSCRRRARATGCARRRLMHALRRHVP